MRPAELLCLVLHGAAAFSHARCAPHSRARSSVLRADGSDDGAAAAGDAGDAAGAAADNDAMNELLRGLYSRVDELSRRQASLPIVVLDSTLPNQRLSISTTDSAFREMIEYCGVKAAEEAGDEQFDDRANGAFGIVGMDRKSGGAFPFGVEAIIVNATIEGEAVSVELRGGRRFTVDDVSDDDRPPPGAVQPRSVTFAPPFDDDDEKSAEAAARQLPALVELWEGLVTEGGHERVPDHLALVRRHLGPMPAPTSPSQLALWIGGYINPLPALGVSLEIRPLLLAATTASERVDAAVAGISSSISHLDGTKRLW
mmetsp:Transcript_15368/g.47703  ORF Transcript_15368/g.47703 Transcript_15368/m.47703 type:complete len:314 (-) Transcript_15368:23-964(-)